MIVPENTKIVWMDKDHQVYARDDRRTYQLTSSDWTVVPATEKAIETDYDEKAWDGWDYYQPRLEPR